MHEDSGLLFDLPAVGRKKLIVAFDGGRLASDAGLLLLREADRRLGISARIATALRDGRDPERVMHSAEDLVRQRALAIACGYEDANDFNTLRHDPLFKIAAGRCPDSGMALASQPTISRIENQPSWRAERDATQADGRLSNQMAPGATTVGSTPSHKVFTVEGEGDDAFWTRIGSAWPTKGDGFNVVLSALPLNGRLVLRPFKVDEPEEEKPKSKASYKR